MFLPRRPQLTSFPAHVAFRWDDSCACRLQWEPLGHFIRGSCLVLDTHCGNHKCYILVLPCLAYFAVSHIVPTDSHEYIFFEVLIPLTYRKSSLRLFKLKSPSIEIPSIENAFVASVPVRESSFLGIIDSQFIEMLS